jgi:hypothetical protein
MRIREENCNMVLLAAVTLVSLVVAGGAALVGSADTRPVRTTNGMQGSTEPTPSPRKGTAHVSDQPLVRVVGERFVPNTHPRER